MGALKAGPLAWIAILLLALPGLVHAQVPSGTPTSPGDVLGPILEGGTGTAFPPTEKETGQDLQGEDIRVAINLDVRNVDYQIVGILFGGGKVAAEVDSQLRFEFRAVSTARLDEAIRQSTGEKNVSVAKTFGIPAHRVALAAEEIRAVGAGALLAAFQSYEADAARKLLEGSVPGLTIVSISPGWENTEPVASLQPPNPAGIPFPSDPTRAASPLPDLREPPLILKASVHLQYLQRTNIVEILQRAARDRSPDESRLLALKRSIQRNETEALGDQTAFNLLGFAQLLTLGAPPGWRLGITMRVPQGFTIEGASNDLEVAADHRGMATVLDGVGRARPAAEAGIVTLSNRYLVTATALIAVLLAGYTLRLPIEAGVLWGSHILDRRRGGAAVQPRLLHWPGAPLTRPESRRVRKAGRPGRKN